MTTPLQDKPSGPWHYRGPVVFSPLFNRPPDLIGGFNMLAKRWITISRNVLFLGIALVVYFWLLPPMQTMQTLSWDWVLPVFVRNIVLMLLIAGGLHAYLFTYRAQDKQTKFDAREKMGLGKQFTFGHQVRDNMFWSLASGVTIWSIYEVLYFWGVANQVIPTFGFSEHPIAFAIWLLVMPLWISTHFFWIHRLLHWPPLFESVHKLHHRNIHIGPWSGMSMHPVEHIIYISSVLIHFVIPSHPVIVLIHFYLRSLTPAFSHAGFEKLVVRGKTVSDAADFHHQLHHKHFECNYGSVEVPWDRWIGAAHVGTDADSKLILARRRQMYRNRKTAGGA